MDNKIDLRAERIMADLTLEKAAKLLKMAKITLQRIESGEVAITDRMRKDMLEKYENSKKDTK